MKKKYQVFISSTYNDLKEERQAIVDQVLKEGLIPAGMELFRADDSNQKDIIKKWIEESDIYILVLGSRYGSIDSETELSSTEWEYQLAGKLDKPRIVLTLSDDWLKQKLQKAQLETNQTSLPQYINFKNQLRNSGRYAHEVTNILDLKLKVSENLKFVIENAPEKLAGWIKATTLDEVTSSKKFFLH